jgi:hypothetical protein
MLAIHLLCELVEARLMSAPSKLDALYQAGLQSMGRQALKEQEMSAVVHQGGA